LTRNYEARKAKEAEIEAITHTEEQRAKKERAEELERQQRAKEARDTEERNFGPAERTARILSVLPDVCEAKRLLAKAPEPKAAALQKARAAVAAAEAKQVAAERKDFAAMRSVVCADGWTSTCLCSHMGSGCCSSHRGVAGCEPYPKEVLCSTFN